MSCFQAHPLLQLLILACLVLSAQCAKFKRSGDGAGDRLAHLQSLASQSSSNLIELDNDSYEYYVVEKPRDYSLVVLLNALNPKYKCAVCKDVEKDVATVAQSYQNARKRQGDIDDKTFFVKLDFEKGGSTFIAYDMNTVPVLFHINARDGVGEGKSPYTISAKERFPFPETTNAEAIAEWVTYKSGVDVKIEKSAFMAYVMTILCFGGIAALVPRIINSLDTYWLPLAQSKKLWGFVSIVVYTCAISGLIFDIIRNPPWYQKNPRGGGNMYIYPQASNQFVVEGFIIGFLNIGCAASLLWTVLKAPKLDTAEKRSIGVISGVMAFAAFFWQIRSIYVLKNRWYGSDM